MSKVIQSPNTNDGNGNVLLEQDIAVINAKMLQEYKKTEEDLESDVNILLGWLKTQPHLPETDNKELVMKFLLINKFSIEKTKPKLDMYYSIRKFIPEMFINPNTPSMIEQRRVVPVIALPKLSKNSSRVIVVRLSDKYPSSKLNPDEMYSNLFATMEVLIKEDRSFQTDIISDELNVKLEHVPKLDFMLLKKCQKVFEKVFSNRVANIHIANVPSFLANLVNLIKSYLPEKLAQRLHVHRTVDSLLEFYSKDMLPPELGGTGLSLDTLNDLWDKKFQEYADRFDKLDAMAVNESLRPEPLENDDVLGWHGNFKKLNVD